MKKSYIKSLRVKKQQKKGLTIAVAGLAGSGKSSLGRVLSKKFGLQHVIPGNIFRDMAAERNMEFNAFLKTLRPEDDREMDRRLLKHAMRGNVLIDSRLAAWVAGDYADYSIFVTAPIRERARRVAGREGMDIKTALVKVRDRDEGDAARYKRAYGVDLADLSIYDLVLNNEFFDRRTTSQIVSFVLKRALSGRRE